jgi:universal stress protein E
MDRFKRILFVVNGPETNPEALARALSLAIRNEGELALLVLHPALPDNLKEYRQQFADFLKHRADANLQTALETLGLDRLPASVTLSLHTDTGHAPQVQIIRRVLRDGYDLVFKAADQQDNSTGFMALDMGLLRACPVPVWLWRASGDDPKSVVAVAIDPTDEGVQARALSLRLIEAGDHLASLLGTKLVVLSCWDYPLESYLRARSFGPTPDNWLENAVDDSRRRNLSALNALIREAGPENKADVHHYRGQPEQRIPEYTQDNPVHTLVMGTLARTGIPGFVIGNTAENLVRRLNCGLLAMKPRGFVSPVKAGS